MSEGRFIDEFDIDITYLRNIEKLIGISLGKL